MHYRFLRFPGGKDKAVTLSYDDGVRSDLRLLERVQHYGLRCTLNLCSFSLTAKPDGRYLTPEEIEAQILAQGHEIAIHGAAHKANGCVRAIEGIQDVLECRLALEKRFGQIIRGMAYPDCGITHCSSGMTKDCVKVYLRDFDIAYERSLGVDGERFTLPEDWLEWIPTVHHSDPHAISYAEHFVSLDIQNAYCANREARLFYLWGHSFEFDQQDNWKLLDELCERISGQKEIWYATNMEIYNYVTAYRKLIFSADGQIAMNPTLQDIWFDYDGQLYLIPTGQTIRL